MQRILRLNHKWFDRIWRSAVLKVLRNSHVEVACVERRNVRAVGALQAGVVGGIDTESGTLIFDEKSRPPGLVERALVAPVGRLPARQRHRDTEVLVYSGVPAPVLDELSRI